jgi:hypothetical protein
VTVPEGVGPPAATDTAAVSNADAPVDGAGLGHGTGGLTAWNTAVLTAEEAKAIPNGSHALDAPV